MFIMKKKLTERYKYRIYCIKKSNVNSRPLITSSKISIKSADETTPPFICLEIVKFFPVDF